MGWEVVIVSNKTNQNNCDLTFFFICPLNDVSAVCCAAVLQSHVIKDPRIFMRRNQAVTVYGLVLTC